MRYFESLVIGFLIGCTALLAQVFASVFYEIIFATSFPLHFSTQTTMPVMIRTIFVIAAIEEILRFVFIMKKFDPRVIRQISSRDLMTHGALLGCGFMLCEFLLALINPQYINTTLYLMIWPLIIHTTTSIFLTYMIYTHYFRKMLLLCVILFAIFYHACANIMIFISLN